MKAWTRNMPLEEVVEQDAKKGVKPPADQSASEDSD